MTAVQERVLRLLPTDRDLFVRAKTGTGKTIAFIVAALEIALARNGGKLDRNKTPMLVVAPTRELANQIAEEAEKLLGVHEYRVKTLTGGTPGLMRRLRANLGQEWFQMLVATPGTLAIALKIIPELKEKLAGLQTVGCVSLVELSDPSMLKMQFKLIIPQLILDEADQLFLDPTFSADIQEILSYLPTTRQTF
ncbi:hypothetical protein HK104_005088, partial [Borealophlyctis nickersoniae]